MKKDIDFLVMKSAVVFEDIFITEFYSTHQ